MGMEQMITQFAMKMFEQELQDPNSAVTQRFKDLLFGDSGSVTSAMESMTPEEQKKAERKERSREKKAMEKRRQQTDEAYNDYKRTTGEKFMDNALPTAGAVAQTLGNMSGIYNSLLGDALLAVSQANAANGQPLLNDMAPGVAMTMKLKGGLGQALGNGVAQALNGIGADLKTGRDKERNAKLMLDMQGAGQPLTGAYWNYQTQANNIAAGR